MSGFDSPNMGCYHGCIEKWVPGMAKQSVQTKGKVWAHDSLDRTGNVYMQLENEDLLKVNVLMDADTAQALGNKLIEAAREARVQAERDYVVIRSDGSAIRVRGVAVREG